PALGRVEPGVVDGFPGRRQCEAIGPRAAERPGHGIGHLGGDPAAKAFGLDERDRTDGARPGPHAFPVRFRAEPERAHHAEARDDDAPHVRVARSAMKAHSVRKDVKCGARSWASSITSPKRSSMASESSMKSSESSPTDPSTPFGSGVSRVTSDTRCGSKRSRVTKIVLTSSRTSLGSMPSSGLRQRRRAPAPPSGHRPRIIAGRARQRERSEEHTSELQSRFDLVCRLLLEKKKYIKRQRESIADSTEPLPGVK